MTNQVMTESITGNELPAVLTLLGPQDKTGYDQGYVQPYHSSDDARPQFSGYATPNSFITIYDGDTPIGTAQADFEGYWRFVPTAPLADGGHDISVTAANDAGTSDRLHYDFPLSIDTSDVQPEQLVINSAFENGGTRVGYMYDFDSRVVHDNRPTIEGTAKANSLVTIKDGDTVLGTAQTDQWGNWSFTPSQALENGPHSLHAVVDGQSSASFDLNIESVPAPQVTYVFDDVDEQGYLTSGSTTDDTNPTIQGTAETYSLVTIYDNGVPIGTVQANRQGAWSFTPDTPLNDGTHHLSAEVNGQSSGTSFVINVANHTDVPALTIDSVYDDVGNPGYVQPGTTTDDSHPKLEGMAAAGSLVTIYDNGQPIGTVPADQYGHWQFVPQAALIDGSHQLIASAGGQNSAPYVINVDTHVPEAPIIEFAYGDAGGQQDHLSSGATTANNHPQLHGTAEAGSLVTIYDHGIAVGMAKADEQGAWTVTLDVILGDGPHNLIANVDGQNSAPFALNIGTHAPAPVISYAYDDVGSKQGYLSSDATTDDNHPQLQGTAAPGNLVTIYDNGIIIGTTQSDLGGHWTFTPNAVAVLSDGMHSLIASVGDQTSAPFVLNVDTHVPVPAISAVYGYGHQPGYLESGDITDSTHPLLQGTATAGSMVKIYDNGELIGTTWADQHGNWSSQQTITLGEGQNSLTIEANGQISAPFVVNIDNHAPPALVLGISGYETPDGYTGEPGTIDHPSYLILHGTAPANTLVTIWDGSTKLGSYLTDASGTWDLRVPDGQATSDGMHHYTVQNYLTGETSAAFDLTIGHVADAQDHATNLALNDVLGAGEGELFTADHHCDNAKLSVHDVLASAVNDMSTQDAVTDGMDVLTQGASTLNANLVLPHEQMHTHAVM
ncbi:hypothetical protein SAMN05216570_1149 [Dyella sp. OK004]|uniref:Ig-like domain-containing protein n=1 Tax=Dyella sp. OK004 TaxID=1855292 RepID=UPI0008E7AF53|nr:Ig-like domain-containing protein [Dyella sp. OK004]SFR95211.1 hypothetical protein SAMN05216570_1149 [Dyella sp. OK004]